MIIDNRFYRFKSFFGYRLRALPSTHQLANPEEDPNEDYSVNFKLVLTNATDQALVAQQVDNKLMYSRSRRKRYISQFHFA